MIPGSILKKEGRQLTEMICEDCWAEGMGVTDTVGKVIETVKAETVKKIKVFGSSNRA